MTTPLAQPPKKQDARFDDWIFRLWKRLTRTSSTELGLGTMADQDADAVAITGGTATLASLRVDSVGVGTAPVTTTGLKIQPSGLTGVNQFAIQANVHGSSAATSAIESIKAESTQADSMTTAAVYGFRAYNPTKGSGSTITAVYGFACNALTVGTTNYGFYSNVESGSGYNFYAAGTAQNHFSGDVNIFGAGKLGYATGSGGTVTQATSRTTGVTLNKTNGAITLVSAAGSATWQSFTLTNSTIAATDTVRVCQKSGTDLYQIHVTAVAAGSCQITYATTGGTTTEQPVFNFAVIKGVTS